jgi:antitoxin (DNA-binding transcriptional repressor) of toxin-antitoxin stability system
MIPGEEVIITQNEQPVAKLIVQRADPASQEAPGVDSSFAPTMMSTWRISRSIAVRLLLDTHAFCLIAGEKCGKRYFSLYYGVARDRLHAHEVERQLADDC